MTPAKNQLWVFRLGVFAGWTVFALMVVAITWAGAVMRDRPFDPGGTFLWNLGWLLWAGATFFVAQLARRFPIERRTLKRDVSVHVLLGISVAAAILCLEFVLNAAAHRFWPGMAPGNALLGFFVYKFHVYFLIYWMVVGGTRAFDYYACFQASALTASRLEAQLAQAQLHALKMQLHPHFLFNTHHSIVSLMLKNENTAAIKMLTRLSELLRITLSQNDRPVTTVREELLALELYLGIQNERYGEQRLAIHRDISAATLEAEIPCLLLQPIVENALKHGIDSRAAGGKLHLKIWREDEQLRMIVADNGAGVAHDFDLEKQSGLGLRNTQARLGRLYGRDYRFELRRGADGGTEVLVTLPFRAAGDAGAAWVVQPIHHGAQ